MYQFFIILAGIVCLGAPDFVSAQVPADAPAATTQSVTTVSLAATVQLRNVRLEKVKGNQYTVYFDLSNTIGAQAGIRYALVFDDPGQEDDVYPLYIFGKTVETLGQGQSVSKFGNFEIPAFFAGRTVNILLVAENENGLTLGAALVGDVAVDAVSEARLILSGCVVKPVGVDVSRPGRAGIDVKPTEKLDASCQVENTSSQDQHITKVDLKTTKRTVLNVPLAQETVAVDWTMKAGEKKTVSLRFSPQSVAQAYHVLVTPVTTLPVNPAHIQYVTAGASATIQNLKLDKSAYQAGESASVYFFFTESAQNFPDSRLDTLETHYRVELQVQSADGTVCGTLSVPDPSAKEAYLAVPITRACPAPVKVTGSVYDATSGALFDTQVLDTKGLTFDPAFDALAAAQVQAAKARAEESAQMVVPAMDQQRPVVVRVVVLTVSVAVALIGGGLYLRKRRRAMLGLVFAFFLFSPVAMVRADTIRFLGQFCYVEGPYTDSSGDHPARTVCVPLTDYVATISLTKSTVPAGAGAALESNISLWSAFLGCTNICDCELWRRISANLSIRDTGGSVVYSHNTWLDSYHNQSVQRPGFIRTLAELITPVAQAGTVTNLFNYLTMWDVSSLLVGTYTADISITGTSLNEYTSTATGTLALPFAVTSDPVVSVTLGSSAF